MRILYLILLIHFIPFQRHGSFGLNKIVLWVTTPLALYLTSALFYASKYIHSHNRLFFNPLTAGIIVLLLLIRVSRHLAKINQLQQEQLLATASRFNTWYAKAVCILLCLVFYIFSIIAGVGSLKYFILMHQ